MKDNSECEVLDLSTEDKTDNPNLIEIFFVLKSINKMKNLECLYLKSILF